MLALILLLTLGAASPSTAFTPPAAGSAQTNAEAAHGIHGSSVQAKILTAIAAGNYSYARELLELAADIGPEEKALLEQTLSAAQRGLLPFFQANLPHIFREAAGHLARDTPEARELIQETATAANLLGVDKWGNSIYARIIDNGSQVWALVRNGFIRDAGVNLTPEPLNRLLKQ